MFPKIKLEVAQFQFDGDAYTKAFRLAVTRAVRLAARAFLLETANRIPVRTGFLRGAFGTLEDVVGSVSGGKIIPRTNPGVKKSKLLRSIKGLEENLAHIPSKAFRRKHIQATLPKGKKREGASKILKEQEAAIAKKKAELNRAKERLKKLAHINALKLHQDRKDTVQGEYYYPDPVGRTGKRKGVHRGILKTPSSGQPFATPSRNILKGGDNTWAFTYGVDIRYYQINDRLRGWDSWRQAIRMYNETLEKELRKIPSVLQYLKTQLGTQPGATLTDFRFGNLIETSGPLESIDESDVISNR